MESKSPPLSNITPSIPLYVDLAIILFQSGLTWSVLSILSHQIITGDAGPQVAVSDSLIADNFCV